MDLDEDNFEVNRGKVSSNISEVRLGNDKQTAEIELTSKLREGEYTVTVKREDQQNLTGSVQAEDETVEGISILSDVAPLSEDKTEATVAYQVTNQYGDDITKRSVSDLTVTAAGSNVKDAKVDSNGKVTINAVGKKELESGDNVTLTIFDKDTGVSTNQKVEISDEAQAAKAEFGELYNEDDKTLSEDNDGTDDTFYMPITVEDQYGNEITDAEDADKDLVITNSNHGVLTFDSKDGQPKVKEVQIDGKDTLALEVEKAKLAGTTNVIAISKSTGNDAKTSIEVEEGNKVDSISIGTSSDLVTAGSDAFLPLNIVDTNGDEVTTKKALKKLDKEYGSTLDNNEEVVEKDDSLFVKVNGSDLTENKPHTVTMVVNGQSATQTFTPEEASTPEVITGLTDDAQTSVRAKSDSTAELDYEDFIVEDQHGQQISSDDLATMLENGYSISVEKIDSNDSPITLSGKQINNKSDSITVEYAGNESSKDSDKVEFALKDKDGGDVEGSKFTQTFNVIEDSAFESYDIKGIDDVYVNENDNGVAEAYQKEIEVQAKTDSGHTVDLDNGEDFSVTSSDFKIENGKIAGYTGTKDLEKNETYTGEVTVTINKSGEELTKEVTFSTYSTKTAEIAVTEDGDKDSKDISDDYKITQGTVDSDSFTGHIYAEDQYGVSQDEGYLENVRENMKLTFTDIPDEATVTENGTKNAEVSGLTDGDTVNVKLADGSAEVQVEVSKDDNGYDGDLAINSGEEIDGDLTLNPENDATYGGSDSSNVTTVKGDVTINGNGSTSKTIDLENLDVEGDLTVDTPNATVNNNADVDGTIDIQDVSGNTWNEETNGNTIVVNDNTNAHLNVNGNVKSLTLNKPTTVNVDNNGSFENAVDVQADSTFVGGSDIKAKIAKDTKVTVKDNSGDKGTVVKGTDSEDEVNVSEKADKAKQENNEAVNSAKNNIDDSYEVAADTNDNADAKIKAVKDEVKRDVSNEDVTVEITEDNGEFTVTLTKGDAKATKDININIAEPDKAEITATSSANVNADDLTLNYDDSSVNYSVSSQEKEEGYELTFTFDNVDGDSFNTSELGDEFEFEANNTTYTVTKDEKNDAWTVEKDTSEEK